MSKYKVGDNVVLTVTGTNEMGCLSCYVLNDNFILLEQSMEKYAEPLSTYTKPLEAKIRRQAAEITRLLAENERLKPNYENIRAKVAEWEKTKLTPQEIAYCVNDVRVVMAYIAERIEQDGDISHIPLTKTEPLEAKIRRQAAEITRLLAENKRLKPNYENIRAKGQNEAWELAQKIFRGAYDNGYSPKELMQIFGCELSKPCIMENTYQEAAAKVAEWERAKEEVKVGDVLEDIYDSNVKCIITNLYPNNEAYLVFDDGTAGMHELDNFKKTGRHIDIDGFLKQIGDE